MSKHRLKGARYKLWQKKVRERDNYQCQRCFEPSAIVHHVFGLKVTKIFFEELDNGIVVCEQCHYIIHKRSKRWKINQHG